VHKNIAKARSDPGDDSVPPKFVCLCYIGAGSRSSKKCFGIGRSLDEVRYPGMHVLRQVLYLSVASSWSNREKMSEGPLGLKSKRSKPHAVLRVTDIPSIEAVRDLGAVMMRRGITLSPCTGGGWGQWIRTLPRSQQATLASQVDKAFKKNGIELTSIGDCTRYECRVVFLRTVSADL
jgi:hypothetical protein